MKERMASTTTTTPFVMRLIGAMACDPVTYEEVEADRSATGQALLVVVLSSVGAGIGARGLGSGSPQSMVFISAVSLVAWVLWAVVTYQIGVKLMPEPDTRSDVGELMRTIGFSAAPGMLRIFGVVPGAAIAAFAITAVWMLVTMIVAVRQALDYKSTARAIAVCGLGWALVVAIAVGLGLVFGPTVS
jgi:Yip1-like protein